MSRIVAVVIFYVCNMLYGEREREREKERERERERERGNVQKM